MISLVGKVTCHLETTKARTLPAAGKQAWYALEELSIKATVAAAACLSAAPLDADEAAAWLEMRRQVKDMQSALVELLNNRGLAIATR